jgi:putative lipoic acid-binding regulatory protein
MTEQTTERGFTFPTTLEVSAMGAADADLERVVPEILVAVGVTIVAGSLRTRPSREGRYVSGTIAFFCPDRATYDAVQRDLRAHPAVRWTL